VRIKSRFHLGALLFVRMLSANQTDFTATLVLIFSRLVDMLVLVAG